MNFQVQHLSDEAVAAFADGMLAVPAHNRALRHVDQCAECALAVDEQRAAVSALRAAPEPALPAGLLERLRAVPVTTSLTPSTMALAPDGSAVFPAYGTVATVPDSARFSRLGTSLGEVPARRHEFHLPVPVPHLGRRTQQLAFVAVAAAIFTVGVAASASANTASPTPASRLAPGNANPLEPAGFSTSRDDTELVGTLTSKRH